MSWRQRRQAARQRRDDILRDLRQNGWRFLRDKGEKVQRVISQAPGKAMASGKQMAKHILNIQRSAKLPARLVAASARSVVYDRQHDSPGHQAWQQGYAEVVRQRVPGVLPEAPKPPQWFERNPRNPEPRDPELEA